MSKKVLTRVAVGVLALAAVAFVAGIAYRAGERSDHDDRQHTVTIVGEIPGDETASGGADSGTRTVLVDVDGGWRRGWRGPGPGIVVVPLVVAGVILLFASRGRGWRGPGPYDDDELREWHRRQHDDAGAAAG